MKKGFLILISILFFGVARGQHAAYYQGALGQNGAQLKTALHNIIDGHNVQSYPLWTAFVTTDDRGSKIWDVYSDIPGSTAPYTYNIGSDQCGQYNSEADCYNHEHLWPKTYFNDASPMNSDLHHIYPTDGWVNNKRASFPFGETNASGYTSQNGSKVASSSSYSSYNGSVFEPIDSFKGDIARVMFYMTTRYQGEDNSWDSWPMANKAVLTTDAITLLMKWHNDDPVSQKELDRNDAVQSIQGNRNPFIDYPEFAECIWGSGNCTALDLKEYATVRFSLFPNPAESEISIKYAAKHTLESIKVFNNFGQVVAQSQLNQLNIEDLTAGMYFIEVQFNKGRSTQTFLKK